MSSVGLPLGERHATDARKSLERARKVHGITDDTPCTFLPQNESERDVTDLGDGQSVGIEDDLPLEVLDATASPEGLKLWPWVNQVCVSVRRDDLPILVDRADGMAPQTPFSVSPHLPLEIVMQLFKRMGCVFS